MWDRMKVWLLTGATEKDQKRALDLTGPHAIVPLSTPQCQPGAKAHDIHKGRPLQRPFPTRKGPRVPRFAQMALHLLLCPGADLN